MKGMADAVKNSPGQDDERGGKMGKVRTRTVSEASVGYGADGDGKHGV